MRISEKIITEIASLSGCGRNYVRMLINGLLSVNDNNIHICLNAKKVIEEYKIRKNGKK